MTAPYIERKKRPLIRALKIFLVISLFCIGLIGYVVYSAFFDMNRLPTGDYLTEKTSPDGTYTVKAYLTNGGATTPYAVRGELMDHRNGKTKNIYWDLEEKANMEWVDSETVVINGHPLHVANEKFDFRNQ